MTYGASMSLDAITGKSASRRPRRTRERLAETRASTRELHGETLGAIRAAPLEKRRRRGPPDAFVGV